jgi:hypothetical protein
MDERIISPSEVLKLNDETVTARLIGMVWVTLGTETALDSKLTSAIG